MVDVEYCSRGRPPRRHWHGRCCCRLSEGRTWTERVLDGEPLLIATAIANGRGIFIAGGTGGFVNGKDLILRSRGAGKSFETSMSGTGATIYELKFHNRTFGHAYGVDGTLLRTTDGGGSLQRIATGTKSKLWALHFFNGLKQTILTTKRF